MILFGTSLTVLGQRIVVDTTSTNKYLIQPEATKEKEKSKEDLSFGDRALSIGKGILNRLKARLNLEEAAESIKNKKPKFLGKKEEEEAQDDGDT